MSRTARAARGGEGRPASKRWVSAASHTRLVTMLVAGLCAAVVTGAAGAWGYAPLAGWDSAALVFTAWVWLAIRPMGSAETASHATREDPGRAATDLIVLIAAGARLGAGGVGVVPGRH